MVHKDLQSGNPRLLQALFDYADPQKAFVTAVAYHCKVHRCVEAVIECTKHEIAACAPELLFRHDTFLVCVLREIIADDVRAWLHTHILSSFAKMTKSTITLLAAETSSDKQTKLCCNVFGQLLEVVLSSQLPRPVADIFSVIVGYLVELKELKVRTACMLVLSNLLMLRAVVPALWVEVKGTRHTFVQLQKMLLSVSLSTPHANMPATMLAQVEKYQRRLRRWARRELAPDAGSQEESTTPETEAVLPADIRLWTVTNVQSWLRMGNFINHQYAFNYNSIDGKALLELDCNNLVEMMLSRLDCLQFMTAINRLCKQNGRKHCFNTALLQAWY